LTADHAAALDLLSPQARLAAACSAAHVAAHLLKPHTRLFQQFGRERETMENVGPIIAPTLYRNLERLATSDTLAPVFEAAARFVAAFEEAEVAQRAHEQQETAHA